MEDEEHATTAKMNDVRLDDRLATAATAAAAVVAGKKEPGSAASSADASKAGSRASSMSPDARKPRSDSASTPDAGGATTQQPPKLSRKASQKPAAREPKLFDHLPNMTAESVKTFQLIPDCLYGSKHMGSTDGDALDCECKEEFENGQNLACGEDSGCINRATRIECVAIPGESTCGDHCQNQRFQRKEYADVSVIKTEKKGFGLRANQDLQANDFIFEYIGEVINEATFRRRMLQYDEEGIKHFYFMSLTKTEFVDATKKGNLGRFCNHSCNPNCYVDKWIVGEKLRMGIFALRPIKVGEELVFNYNVDRYGADPQPCYCGEDNCTGYIGGKTQTERATKLPLAMVEALGIDDGDTWDTAVSKKPRKKRPDEDDEEYVNSVQARSLDEDGARKVMSALMQCKEKWIAVKLMERIERCRDERVIQTVMRMHADQILKTILNSYIDDHNVVLQVLHVLGMFPRLTKNKIVDSKIEAPIQQLTDSEHEDVSEEAKRLLESWSTLKVAFRIRRRNPNDVQQAAKNSFHDERRNAAAEREEEASVASKVASPLNIENIPKGPRSNIPQRNANFYSGPRPPRRPNFNGPLPEGWFSAKDARGNTYYYSKNNVTTWQRPTRPAEGPAPVTATAKAKHEEAVFQSIIEQISKEHATPRPSAVQTPQQQPETPAKEVRKDKWRTLTIEKQQKIYENTLYRYVKHVMDRYRHKLPKEDLKRFSREVNKKLVASDYKNNRVKDPTAPLGEKEERKVKAYVKEFFDKAVVKYRDHEKRRKARESANGGADKVNGQDSASQTPTLKEDEGIVVEDTTMSDDEAPASPSSPERKRKRTADDDDDDVDMESPLDDGATPTDGPSSTKRLKEDDAVPAAISPPPPPPPPMEEASPGEEVLTEEQKALREQEEALMRENEEAQRLEDEAEMEKQRAEESMRGYEDGLSKGLEKKDAAIQASHQLGNLSEGGDPPLNGSRPTVAVEAN